MLIVAFAWYSPESSDLGLRGMKTTLAQRLSCVLIQQ